MKTTFFFLFLFSIIAINCGKDKFTSIPQITINSISPDSVNSGDIVVVKGKFTDEEGDIDSILIVRKFYNGAIATRSDTLERILFESIGAPKGTRQADLQLTFEYNTQNTGYRTLTGVQKDTTATLGILLIDKKMNRSEFKESNKVRLKK